MHIIPSWGQKTNQRVTREDKTKERGRRRGPRARKGKEKEGEQEKEELGSEEETIFSVVEGTYVKHHKYLCCSQYHTEHFIMWQNIIPKLYVPTFPPMGYK